MSNLLDKQQHYLASVLHTENMHLKKLHSIVHDAMKEEELIVKNLMQKRPEALTTGQRIADKVATFGGSWAFIITFCVILVCWIVVNIILASKAFDPYPFILLNLILSCIAALQAPVIMMSQNRQEEKDRQRAENDYMVNLKAEIEIRNLHQKINLLMEEQFQTLIDIQRYQVELLEEIAGWKK
ncbi:MAG: DUF1003 domain-containing protein [Saprospiraceae bacterium]|nr:DUF1003 domain-containing protein [Saprospiraceae bacterium]